MMSRMVSAGLLGLAVIVIAFGVATRVLAQDATPEPSESGESLPGGLVLRLIERAETDVLIDQGETGDSVGDLMAFGNPIYDPANESKLGDNQGSCVRTVVGQSWECSWTLILPEGQITVQGPLLDAADSTLAITGGTGAYRDARGQLSIHPRDAERAAYDLTYEIE